jgi:hypothetical protein
LPQVDPQLVHFDLIGFVRHCLTVYSLRIG